MIVTVNLKKISKRKNSIEKIPFEFKNIPKTAEELILEAVRSCVKDYNERHEKDEILQNLTLDRIEDMSISGKISFGARVEESCAESKADLKKAEENAILCFKDGIYRVFLNDEQLTDLDEKIHVDESSNITFIRMTMLAGRIW